jgi:hypothetical protein
MLYNILRSNKLQLYLKNVWGRQTPLTVRYCSCSFWARYVAAQKTMGRRLGSRANPRWATLLFDLQNAPRRKPLGAALRGGKSLS